MCKHSCHPPYIFCQFSVKRNMTFTVPKIIFFSVFHQEKREVFCFTQGRSHCIINRFFCQQCVNFNCKQPVYLFIRMDMLPIFYIYLSNKAMDGSPLMNQIINLSPNIWSGIKFSSSHVSRIAAS